MKRILTLTDAFERGAYRYKFKRTVALIAVILALGLSYAHPAADNSEIIGKIRARPTAAYHELGMCRFYDGSISSTLKGDCHAEFGASWLSEDELLQIIADSRKVEWPVTNCSPGYEDACKNLEHETDWLRGPKR